jgi:FkbM family methyltransferase
LLKFLIVSSVLQPSLSITQRQPIRHGLASSKLLRALVLPLLRRLDWAITIKNPFSGLPFQLLSFTHKGYWFYGKHREKTTMQNLSRHMRPGDVVFEVGGHIGYLSQFFAKNVGADGQVHIFEPGAENQKFLRKNIARCNQCVHINAAVSDYTGKALFYEENLGGFMNSLDAEFATSSDIAKSQRSNLAIKARKVNASTLDAYATAHNAWPQVIKIDAEGAEHAVLRGGSAVLKSARVIMIEVSRYHADIFNILTNAGFAISQPDGAAITNPDDMDGNVFATRVI